MAETTGAACLDRLVSDLGMDSDAMVSGSPVLCARRSAPEAALCGAPGFSTLHTNERRYVSCPVASPRSAADWPTPRGGPDALL
jgi:hypothetical protein